jgi:hypothetical protein
MLVKKGREERVELEILVRAGEVTWPERYMGGMGGAGRRRVLCSLGFLVPANVPLAVRRYPPILLFSTSPAHRRTRTRRPSGVFCKARRWASRRRISGNRSVKPHNAGKKGHTILRNLENESEIGNEAKRTTHLQLIHAFPRLRGRMALVLVDFEPLGVSDIIART